MRKLGVGLLLAGIVVAALWLSQTKNGSAADTGATVTAGSPDHDTADADADAKAGASARRTLALAAQLERPTVPQLSSLEPRPGERPSMYESRKELVLAYSEAVRSLGLSPEQDEQLRVILGDTQHEVMAFLTTTNHRPRYKYSQEEAMDLSSDIVERARSRVADVLTPEQQAVFWKDLDPFLIGLFRPFDMPGDTLPGESFAGTPASPTR